MRRLVFDSCEIDPERRMLLRQGRAVEVQPKVLDLLLHLIEHRHRVVSYDELRAAIWPGVTVTRSALTRAIVKARQAVGDSGEAQSVIRTVHRVGVRFVAVFEPGGDAESLRQGELRLAKLTPPRTRPLTRRARLLDWIEGAPPAIWISGPPGAGKTSLALSYAAESGASLAWFQLDSRDADPASFFDQLGLLAMQLAPLEPPPVPFGAQYYSALSEFARRRFEDLFARATRPFVLVFDDVHQVPEGAPLFGVLTELVSAVPEDCRVVFTSREKAPGELARDRINRRFAELDSNALPLGADEALLLIRTHTSSALSAEREAELVRQAAGWVAGLFLLIERESANGETRSPEIWKPIFSADYFEHELFAALGPREQRVLLRAALVPRVDAQHADEIVQTTGALEVLEDLEARNLFTQLRGNAYEFHPLFREFLATRAETVLDPQERRACQRSGAQVLARSGEIDDAVSLFAEASDWGSLSELIEGHAASLIDRGRTSTLLLWLRQLPERYIHERGWLSYWLGRAGILLGFDAARDALEHAFARFGEDGDLSGQAFALAAMLDLYFFEWNSLVPMDRWLDHVQPLLDVRLSETARSTLEISGGRAMNYRQPKRADFVELRRLFDRVTSSDRDPAVRLRATFSLGYHFVFAGCPREAWPVLEEARALIHEGDDVQQQALDVLSSGAAWHEGRIRLSMEIAQRALDRAEQSGVRILEAQILVNLLYGAILSGDSSLAGTHIERLAAHLASNRSSLHHSHLGFLRGWEAAMRDDLKSSTEYSAGALRLGREAGMPFAEAFCALLCAQIALTSGKLDEAAVQLDPARVLGRDSQSHLLRFATGMLDSEIAAQRGEERKAEAALRQSLAIARAQGTPCFPGCLPWLFDRARERALTAGIEADFAAKLGRDVSGVAG